MSTPSCAATPVRRRRLVDYSDSDSDSDAEDAPPPATFDAPETENELANIVIKLQHKYINEVEALEARNDQMRREMRDWKANVDARMRMQTTMLESLVYDVHHIHIDEFVALKTLKETEASGLPSPSATPSQDLPNGAEPPEPSPTASGKALSERSAETDIRAQVSIERSMFPTRTRSTGKKAPRPRTTKPNSPHCGLSREPRKLNAKGGRAPAVPRTIADRTPAIDDEVSNQAEQPPRGCPPRPEIAPELASDIAPTPASEPASQQNMAEPCNPYDDPKYFSPLTVVGSDGVRRPIFKFHKHPDTVEEQWAEYKHGLHGQPAVEVLERVYRAKWRSGTYSRSWFTRRKAFWDKMKEMMAGGMTESEALNVMRSLAKGSVPGLIAQLCKERGGKGGRSMKRGRSSELTRGGGRGISAEGEAAESDAESVDGGSSTGRTSPFRLRRKRVRMTIDEGGESEDEAPPEMDIDSAWEE